MAREYQLHLTPPPKALFHAFSAFEIYVIGRQMFAHSSPTGESDPILASFQGGGHDYLSSCVVPVFHVDRGTQP